MHQNTMNASVMGFCNHTFHTSLDYMNLDSLDSMCEIGNESSAMIVYPDTSVFSKNVVTFEVDVEPNNDPWLNSLQEKISSDLGLEFNMVADQEKEWHCLFAATSLNGSASIDEFWKILENSESNEASTCSHKMKFPSVSSTYLFSISRAMFSAFGVDDTHGIDITNVWQAIQGMQSEIVGDVRENQTVSREDRFGKSLQLEHLDMLTERFNVFYVVVVLHANLTFSACNAVAAVCSHHWISSSAWNTLMHIIYGNTVKTSASPKPKAAPKATPKSAAEPKKKVPLFHAFLPDGVDFKDATATQIKAAKDAQRDSKKKSSEAETLGGQDVVNSQGGPDSQTEDEALKQMQEEFEIAKAKYESAILAKEKSKNVVTGEKPADEAPVDISKDDGAGVNIDGNALSAFFKQFTVQASASNVGNELRTVSQQIPDCRHNFSSLDYKYYRTSLELWFETHKSLVPKHVGVVASSFLKSLDDDMTKFFLDHLPHNFSAGGQNFDFTEILKTLDDYFQRSVELDRAKELQKISQLTQGSLTFAQWTQQIRNACQRLRAVSWTPDSAFVDTILKRTNIGLIEKGKLIQKIEDANPNGFENEYAKVEAYMKEFEILAKAQDRGAALQIGKSDEQKDRGKSRGSHGVMLTKSYGKGKGSSAFRRNGAKGKGKSKGKGGFRGDQGSVTQSEHVAGRPRPPTKWDSNRGDWRCSATGCTAYNFKFERAPNDGPNEFSQVRSKCFKCKAPKKNSNDSQNSQSVNLVSENAALKNTIAQLKSNIKEKSQALESFKTEPILEDA